MVFDERALLDEVVHFKQDGHSFIPEDLLDVVAVPVNQNDHDGDDALYLNNVDYGDDGVLHLHYVKNHVDFHCLLR